MYNQTLVDVRSIGARIKCLYYCSDFCSILLSSIIFLLTSNLQFSVQSDLVDIGIGVCVTIFNM